MSNSVWLRPPWRSHFETQDARLDGVVSEFQAQFSTAEEQRRADFSQVVEEGRTQLRETVETTNAAAKEAVEQRAVTIWAQRHRAAVESARGAGR